MPTKGSRAARTSAAARAKRQQRQENHAALAQDPFGRKGRFLVAFRKWGKRSSALREADISYGTLTKWLAEDPAFAAAVKEIEDEFLLAQKEELEESAFRRAVSRSDQLAKFILSKLDPSYADRIREDRTENVTLIMKENLSLDDL